MVGKAKVPTAKLPQKGAGLDKAQQRTLPPWSSRKKRPVPPHARVELHELPGLRRQALQLLAHLLERGSRRRLGFLQRPQNRLSNRLSKP